MKNKPISMYLDNEKIKLQQQIIKFFCNQFDINRSQFDINPQTFLLSKKEYKRLRKNTITFSEGKDVTFKIGYRWFYNIRLNVKKRVFVPQPDTERLVDLILEDYKKSKKQIDILEIGTGSGAIPIALAKNLSKVRIVAIDRSRKALKLALVNAVQNTALDKIDLRKRNFLKNSMEGTYDIIVSNPPYIGKGDNNVSDWVKKNQPMMALYAKHSGIDFYNKIFYESNKLLKPGGKVYLEIGFEQKEILQKIIPADFTKHKFYKDINSNYRYLVLEK